MKLKWICVILLLLISVEGASAAFGEGVNFSRVLWWSVSDRNTTNFTSGGKTIVYSDLYIHTDETKFHNGLVHFVKDAKYMHVDAIGFSPGSRYVYADMTNDTSIDERINWYSGEGYVKHIIDYLHENNIKVYFILEPNKIDVDYSYFKIPSNLTYWRDFRGKTYEQFKGTVPMVDKRMDLGFHEVRDAIIPLYKFASENYDIDALQIEEPVIHFANNGESWNHPSLGCYYSKFGSYPNQSSSPTTQMKNDLRNCTQESVNLFVKQVRQNVTRTIPDMALLVGSTSPAYSCCSTPTLAQNPGNWSANGWIDAYVFWLSYNKTTFKTIPQRGQVYYVPLLNSSLKETAYDESGIKMASGDRSAGIGLYIRGTSVQPDMLAYVPGNTIAARKYGGSFELIFEYGQNINTEFIEAVNGTKMTMRSFLHTYPPPSPSYKSSSTNETPIIGRHNNPPLPYVNRIKKTNPNICFQSSEGMCYETSRGHFDSGKSIDPIRTLINLTNYSGSLTNANFSFVWNDNRTNNPGSTVGIFRITKPWVTNYTTWNTYNESMPWDMPGGDWADRDNTTNGEVGYCSWTIPAGATDYRRIYCDLTQLVQEWTNGTYPNFGLIIKADSIAEATDNTYIEYAGYDDINYPRIPKLTILSPLVLPEIISWSNNYTNNNSLAFTIPASTSIRFNVTADQGDMIYFWALNDITLIGKTSNETTISISSIGNNSVKLYGTNFNGSTQQIIWNIIVENYETIFIPNPVINTGYTSNDTTISFTFDYNQSSGNITDDYDYNLITSNLFDIGISKENNKLVISRLDQGTEVSINITSLNSSGTLDGWGSPVTITGTTFVNTTADKWQVCINTVTCENVTSPAFNYEGTPGESVDIAIRSWSEDYGTWSMWVNSTESIEGGDERMPSSPISLSNTSGNFYVNHTWSSGTGNITDSYNVSVNGTWTNGSALTYMNTTAVPHDWVNISVYAYNSSGAGTLNLTGISMNTQVPNNAPTISFIDPTPANLSTNTTGSVQINTSVSDADSDNMTALLNWNNSLVGWWRMNEVSGGTLVQDFSGYGNNGTWNGNTTSNVTTGRFGNALAFDGVDDKVVSAMTNFPLGASPRSVSLWINPSILLNNIYIFGFGFAQPKQLFSISTNADGNITFHGYSDDITSTFTTGLSIDKYYFVAIVYDGTTEIKFYINNISNTQNIGFPLETTGNYFSIGYVGQDYAETAFIQATIDEVRIYNRALSAEEINASYNAGLYRLNPTFSNLSDSTYNYTAYIQDAYGSVIATETRYVAVSLPTERIPPTPISLSNTTGNFWVNHTWQAGSGNITNSYNISIINNSVQSWINDSATTFKNSTLAAHQWSNISVWAYNSSGTGSLSASSLSGNVQIGNNLPILASIGNKTVTEGQWLNFTISATDSDSDTQTYGTNATYTLFNSSTGSYNWSASGVGVYTWNFNVSDGYGGIDSETIIVNVTETGYTIPPTPVSCLASQGNFWINTSCSAGIGNITDSYNKSVNAIWYNNSNPYYNSTLSAHGWQNVSFYAWNTSGALNNTPATLNTQISNNVPIMTAIGSKSVNEGSLLSFTVSGTDADSDGLSCSTNATNGSLVGCGYSWTPSYSDSGNYSFRFYLNDSYSGSDSEIVQITVINAVISDKMLLTLAATNIETDTATLWANITNHTGTDTFWFEFGAIDGIYHHVSGLQTISGNATISYKIPDGYPIIPDRTYYYRVAMSGESGEQLSFSTLDLDQISGFDFDKNFDTLRDANFGLENLTVVAALPYTDVLGAIFWGVIFAIIFIVGWIRQGDVTNMAILGILISGSILAFVSPEFVQIGQALLVVSIAGMLVSYIYKK